MKKKYIIILIILVIVSIIIVLIPQMLVHTKTKDVKNYKIPNYENFIQDKALYKNIVDYINTNWIDNIYSNIEKKIIWFKNNKGEYLFCSWYKTEMQKQLEFYSKSYDNINEIDCNLLYENISILNIDSIEISKNLKTYSSLINSDTKYIIKIYLKNLYTTRNKGDIYIYNEKWWKIDENNKNFILDDSHTITKLDTNWILDNVFVKVSNN